MANDPLSSSEGNKDGTEGSSKTGAFGGNQGTETTETTLRTNGVMRDMAESVKTRSETEFDSWSQFADIAIRNEFNPLQEKLKVDRRWEMMAEYFDRFPPIEVKDGWDKKDRIKITSDELDEMVWICIPVRLNGMYGAEAREAGYRKTDLFRAAMILRLNRLSEETGVFDSKRAFKADISAGFDNVLNAINENRIKFKHFAEEWFLKNVDRTQKMFRQYPGIARDFCWIYEDEFEGTDAEKKAEGLIEERALDNLRSIVKETLGDND